MNIFPIVNSVKCTVFGRFAQFLDVLEGSTARGMVFSYFDSIDFIDRLRWKSMNQSVELSVVRRRVK